MKGSFWKKDFNMKNIIKLPLINFILFIFTVLISQNSCTTSKFSNPGACDKITSRTEQIACKQEEIDYLKKEIAYYRNKYNKPNTNHVYIHASNVSKKKRPFKRYYNNWTKKMMAFANANMPISWRNITVTAKVLIDIALNKNGTIYSVRIIRPSNNKSINNSIIPLITKASPRIPFPEAIKNDVDVLHIAIPFTFTPKNN